MKRVLCGSCGSGDLASILDLGSTPLGDQFPETVEESREQIRYPLGLMRCSRCQLVQLSEIVPDDILFGSDYGFYSGTSKAILNYYDDYAQWIKRNVRNIEDARILEIACNDGGLLDSLKALGITNVMGVDPASGPVKLAREKGYEVDLAPFSSAWALSMRNHKFDLVIANHVAAHTSDLNGFFAGVAEILTPQGDAVIEFQYLPDLLAGNMFDHIYHEHRFFFSLTTFSRAAKRYGLNLEYFTWIDRQGGSMRVMLTKRRINGLTVFPVENWVQEWGTYDGLQGKVDHIKDRLLNLVNPHHGVLAGYGAPAKATTLMHFCGLSRREIAWVQDTTPTKVGKFMPGTDIPITSPRLEVTFGRPDQYLLFVWNYASEILHKETAFLERGGRFIIPIPYPVVI